MEFRSGGSRWGTHRVVKPEGALPQEAFSLNPDFPLFENEIGVAVTALQLDSASFHQLAGEAKINLPPPTPPYKGGEIIANRICEIIRERGKMHNPQTHSGGVFLGTIMAIGPQHPLKETLKVGDSVVSLVSLTLTPLQLSEMMGVDIKKERAAVKGTAILFESGLVHKMPEDLKEGVVLAALDVCGAPAQARRLVREGMKVLILGLGKAGRAIACMANDLGAQVYGIDANSEAIRWCRENLPGRYEAMDSTNAPAVHRWINDQTRGALADIVFHATPAANAEMAAILSCREGGSVLFFGMQTSFQRAVLGAEGMGKDILLMMGNGFVPGHADLMLDLLRKHRPLREWFVEQYS